MYNKKKISNINLNEFYIGLEESDLNYIYEGQHKTNWCWAASTQMVLKSQCLDLSQEKINDMLNKNQDCYPNCSGDLNRVADLLNNKVVGDRKIIANEYPGLPDAKRLIKMIYNGNPVIIGLTIGHAVVLTNLKLKKDFNNVIYISKLYILDPDTRQNNFAFKESEWESISSFIDSSLIIETVNYIPKNDFI